MRAEASSLSPAKKPSRQPKGFQKKRSATNAAAAASQP